MSINPGSIGLWLRALYAYRGLREESLTPIVQGSALTTAIAAGIWLVALAVFKMTSDAPVHIASYAIAGVLFCSFYVLRDRLNARVLASLIAILLMIVASRSNIDVGHAAVGNVSFGFATMLLFIALGAGRAWLILIGALLARAMFRLSLLTTPPNYELYIALLTLMSSLIVSLGVIGLMAYVDRWKAIQRETIARLESLAGDQRQLFALLALETAAPLANIRMLLSQPDISRQSKDDLRESARQLIQIIEGLDIATNTQDIPPLHPQACDLMALAKEVEKQARLLLRLKDIRLEPLNIELPVKQYQLDVPRMRIVLMTVPQLLYLIGSVTKSLTITIKGYRSTDERHALVFSFKMNETRFSAEQLMAALSADSDLAEADEITLRRHQNLALQVLEELKGTYQLEGEGNGKPIELSYVIPAEPARLPMSAKELSDMEATRPLAGKRILLVDDDAIHRRATGSFLKRQFGADVVSAGGGAEALQILESDDRFDLLITDYFMPEVSGAVLIERTHEKLPKLPIIALTATAQNTDLLALRLAGASAVITKPVTERNLLNALRNLTE